MRVLHLASGVGPDAAARALSLAAPALADLGETQSVVNIGPDRPFGKELTAAGVEVRQLRFLNWLDWSRARQLRQTVSAFRPDVVHVWGNRAAVFANYLTHRPMVVTDVRKGLGLSGTLRNRTLRRATVCRDSQPLLLDRPAPIVGPRDVGLPADARVVLNVGGFDARSDQRTAVLAFDILKHPWPGLHLLIAGDGPDRERVERLARMIGRDDDRVHLLGLRADVRSLLDLATLVLVTHRTGGRTVIAEALAAGKPVVAWRTPDTSALVRHEENGLLVPATETVGLPTAMHRLLTDAELYARLAAGAAASPRPISPLAAAREWLTVYRSAVQGPTRTAGGAAQ